jgi:hypothetical protein
MKQLAACFLVAACGAVHNNLPGDAPTLDVGVDTPTANCMTDEFDGTALDARWSTLTGGAPTYNVDASRLFISDAPFSDTPSMSDRSWIYRLDTDRGNQIAWAHSIGAGDFTLTADVGWSSTVAEYTLGAVGVSDAQGTIAAMAGAMDGNNTTNGSVFGIFHVVGGRDMKYEDPQNREPGAARVQIQRTGDKASITIDGAQRMSGALPDLISNVVIVYVRFKNGTTLSDFGSLEVRQIQICLP